MVYCYQCAHTCDLAFERDYPIGQLPTAVLCPVCHRPARRVYTVPAATIYRGTGWSGRGHGIPDMDERSKMPGPLDFSDLMEE